jgi:ABC-type branched-subunit amino acid transport system substrate-binding protein
VGPAPLAHTTRMSSPPARLAAVLVLVAGAAGCLSAPAPDDEGIRIGLILSYTGYLAANSINSERALVMAVDAVNAAGGIAGQPLRIIEEDTRSNGNQVKQVASKLLEQDKVALFIGPDTTDLVTQLRTLLQGRTMMLPSYATASDVEFKPASWFVMGAGISRVACEIMAQLRVDQRQRPVVIVNPTGYTSSLSWELGNTYGLKKEVLPTDRATTAKNVEPIANLDADAFVLAAFPSSASSLIYALAATGRLQDPARWYLLPTLHTPAFLSTIPKDTMNGVRGVSPGTVAGAGAFRSQFATRWLDAPLDDAYPFYDAGIISALALARAVARDGAIPTGTGLSPHIVAVTATGGTRIGWDEVGRGLDLLAQGQEVEYIGLTGALNFDPAGQAVSAANTNWWTINGAGFADLPRVSDCK